MTDLKQKIEKDLFELNTSLTQRQVSLIAKMIEENYIPKESNKELLENINLEEEDYQCRMCGSKIWGRHQKGCIHNDPLAYNEVGYG